MLKFGQNQVEWADIDAVNIDANDLGVEVSITVGDTVLVVGIYDAADRATSVRDMIAANKAAVGFGGVLVEVIIDDL